MRNLPLIMKRGHQKIEVINYGTIRIIRPLPSPKPYTHAGTALYQEKTSAEVNFNK
jgi:hypothetical protein